MSVIDKLRKRRCYPVEIDGETLHVTALTTRVIAALSEVDDNGIWSSGVVLGFGLLNDDETPVFQQRESESFVDFGNRVIDELDAPLPIVTQLVEAIKKVTRPADAETLAKN